MFNSFGKKIHGSIGVDINEIAGQIAKNIADKQEEMRIKARQAQEEAKWVKNDSDVWLIGRKTDKGYTVETVEPVLNLGDLKAFGHTLEVAKANLRFMVTQGLMKRKTCPDLNSASERCAKIKFYMADVIGDERKIQVGSGD